MLKYLKTYLIYYVTSLQKKARVQRELTLQDMYNQDSFDDDDEDDSDWEPMQKHFEIMNWFCTNCTMVNLDDFVHCDVCSYYITLSYKLVV